MATLDQGYADLIAAFEAARLAWSGAAFDVQYPGQNSIDPLTQDRPFVALDFEDRGGLQLDLGPVPMVREDATLVIAVAVKCGSGYREATRIRDHFVSKLELRDIGAVRTATGYATRMREQHGWDYRPIVLPFWLTRFKQ